MYEIKGINNVRRQNIVLEKDDCFYSRALFGKWLQYGLSSQPFNITCHSLNKKKGYRKHTAILKIFLQNVH